MTFLSGFELVNKRLRQEAEERARQAITPQHAACEAALGDDDEQVREQARRVQHLADPVGEVVAPDMDKVFRDAFPGPAAYPDPSAMSPGRGPVHLDLTAGRAAPSPGSQPASAFNVPRATLNVTGLRRGPITDGHAAPSPSHLEAS